MAGAHIRALRLQVALACSTLFACGVALLISSNCNFQAGRYEGHPEVIIAQASAISIAVQVPYDAILDFLIKCNCVQTWSDKWKKARDCIGVLAFQNARRAHDPIQPRFL